MTKEERKELVVEVMEILTRKKEERKECEIGLKGDKAGEVMQGLTEKLTTKGEKDKNNKRDLLNRTGDLFEVAT